MARPSAQAPVEVPRKRPAAFAGGPFPFFECFMTICGQHSAVKYEPSRRTAVSLRCRAWTCEECRPKRKAQLIAQAVGGQPNMLITLTSRKTDEFTIEEAAKRLSHAWRCCRYRIMRKYGIRRLPFFLVVEQHKSGWPHFHILLRSAYIDQKWLSDTMSDLVDGPNVWINRIDYAGRVAAYCAKYCGKCAAKIGTTKRYWQSRDYDLRTEALGKALDSEERSWSYTRASITAITRQWNEAGWTLKKTGAHVIEATAPPGAGGPAPPDLRRVDPLQSDLEPKPLW